MAADPRLASDSLPSARPPRARADRRSGLICNSGKTSVISTALGALVSCSVCWWATWRATVKRYASGLRMISCCSTRIRRRKTSWARSGTSAAFRARVNRNLRRRSPYCAARPATNDLRLCWGNFRFPAGYLPGAVERLATKSVYLGRPVFGFLHLHQALGHLCLFALNRTAARS